MGLGKLRPEMKSMCLPEFAGKIEARRGDRPELNPELMGGGEKGGV